MAHESSGAIESTSSTAKGRFGIRLEANGDGECVVVVSGDVDVASGPQLRTVLGTAVDGARRVVVDVGGVDFIDSTGLNAIVRARHRAQASGGEVVVREAGPRLIRLFELTGVDGLMDAQPPVAEPAAPVIPGR